jgi:hypothetical protein
MIFGLVGTVHFYGGAVNGIEHGRWEMFWCFLVSLLMIPGGCGLYRGAIWARILVGVLLAFVTVSCLSGLALALIKHHPVSAVGIACLIAMCIFTWFAIFQTRATAQADRLHVE